MNNIVWKQYDSRWGSKAYPKGSTMSGCGCGCVACTHIAMEQQRYANWTPENLRPWMVKQGFAIRGQGTTWNGITKTLQHLGYKVVHIGISDPMSKAWTELNKGNRIGIILFKSGKAPNGTVWTASGHYVAFTDYYVKDGKHYFYTKDSGGRGHDSKTHGYYTYERSMKGTVYQMWIVERLGAAPVTPTPTPEKKTTPTTTKLTVDGIGGPATVKAAQRVFGTTIDGVISGQSKTLRKYYPAFSSISIKYGTKGSPLVKKMQKKVKVKADGIMGQSTVKAWQKFLGLKADGIWGKSTMKAFQKWLNGQLNPTTKTTSTPAPAPTPTPTPVTPVTPVQTPSVVDMSKSETIIDVSYVQKSIDWNKVKAAGVKGAIIRCGYRGYGSGALSEDSMFMNHITGANKAGLKLGIYFFTEAINAAEGKAEAQFAIKQLKKAGVKLTYPIAVDTENINAKNPVPRANSTKLSAAKRTEAIKAFCEEIKANGYEPMIYASTEWLNKQLNMSKLPYKVWVAQYNTKVTYKGSYVIWQYSSVGKVNGISGVVDMNHSYINVGTTTAPAPTTVTPVPTPTPTPTPTPITPAQSEVTIPPTQVATPTQYKGTLPSLKIVKSNAQVIEDAIKWAKWIAGDNRFHYGKGKDAHHNGCYFCDTQPKSKKNSGILDYKFTYCCNPFIGAAWAHGGCIPKALDMCQHGNSWDFNKGSGYDKSSLFTNLGHPAQSTLKPGDVLCNDTHVAMYIGNGKIVEASGGDDNKRNSTKWNNSIRVTSLSALRYKGFKRVHRFNSSVNTTMVIRYGEVSDRIKELQKFLNWYFGKEVCAVDGIFGDGTLKYVKLFQTARKLAVDGIIGANTISEMGKVTK